MFEACAVTVGTNGDPIMPYYNAIDMNSYLNGYFNESLSRYVKDFSYTFEFQTHSGSYCTNQCRRVQIRLIADINYLYKYDKTQVFTIVNGDTL